MLLWKRNKTPDEHMLDGLTRTSHVHRVWKIGPSHTVVVELILRVRHQDEVAAFVLRFG